LYSGVSDHGRADLNHLLAERGQQPPLDFIRPDERAKEKRLLGPGDSVFMPAGVVHAPSMSATKMQRFSPF
jgi:hypothetical protein